MGRARLPQGRNLCHYCEVRPGITTDHIVPRALGGPDAIWNYVSSCPTCNLDKGATWPTCACDKCTSAVARFLSIPGKRQRVLDRLVDQATELTDGIEALRERQNKLRRHRNKLNALYSHIINFPIDDDVIADSVVRKH